MRQDCSKIVDEIAAALLSDSSQKSIGLYSGRAGISLFLFYYARLKGSADIHQQASKILDQIFDQIETTPHPQFSLCTGIAGVGWLVNHLCQQKFMQTDANEMLSDIDEYLYRIALLELNKGHFDFMHGALGIALYFIKRKRQDYLHHLIQALAIIANQDGNGLKWQSVIDHEEGTKGFNIALSHGSSSIVLILCKILQIMPEEENIKTMLTGAVNYILNQEISVEQYGCFFPSLSLESQLELFKTRLAWCYGDLGVALAIWKSGTILQNQTWTNKGMEVLLHAASRRRLQENRVQDAGICHGTAGIAHIFSRLFHDTARNEFKDAANYWITETIKMAKFKDGLAGYKTWHHPKYGGWQTDNNLLDGIAGIGMSLLSFLDKNDPAWDECLLLT